MATRLPVASAQTVLFTATSDAAVCRVYIDPMLPRTLTPELMDAPSLERGPHWHALAGLARINRWSRSTAILWPQLARLAKQLHRPLRLLDVATGAGDLPIALAQRANREGLQFHIDACDISEDALAYARKHAGNAVHFFPHDALAADLPPGYDAVTSSLFLHHLTDEQAVTLLSRLATTTQHLVLVNDLRRCRRGWWLAYLGTRLLSRSPIVHTDGPRSVEGAFTISEARALAEKAGLHHASVFPRWPCRWLLTWTKPHA